MFCMSCGKQIPDEATFCPICGVAVAAYIPASEVAALRDESVPPVEEASPVIKAPPAPKKKHPIWMGIGIAALSIFAFFVGIIILGASINASKNVGEPQPQVIEETKEEYVASCQVLDYTEISRNPAIYKGQRVVFRGKVVQVSESYSDVILRVDTTEGEYGWWEDTVYVTYKTLSDDESRILEDDIVNLYGEYKGIKSYTAVLGNEISIPEIEAKYIELALT